MSIVLLVLWIYATWNYTIFGPSVEAREFFLIPFAMSVMIEVSQGIWGLGLMETDDVMCNTLGACVGYGCYWMKWWTIYNYKKWRK